MNVLPFYYIAIEKELCHNEARYRELTKLEKQRESR
jgi:hypothetical protein